MAINRDHNIILTAVSCSNVRQQAFADGLLCFYTAVQPGKASANEDAIAVIGCQKDSGVLVVADGLGGMPGGDMASALAINELCTAVSRGCTTGLALRESILDGIEQANTRIMTSSPGSATTIIAIEVNGQQIRSYHVGDSMALITGQRGKVKYQTIPHSPVGYAVEAGLLEEEDAMQHDERHLISNMVGSQEMRVEIGPPITLAKRDTLILASDGLFDNLTIDEIVDIIRCGPLEQAARQLVSICKGRMEIQLNDELHKPDDLSFVLYRGD